MNPVLAPQKTQRNPCELDGNNQSDLEESLLKMQKAAAKKRHGTPRAPSEETEADYEVADQTMFEDIATVVNAEAKAEKSTLNNVEAAPKDSTPVRPPGEAKVVKNNAQASSNSSSSEDSSSERT